MARDSLEDRVAQAGQHDQFRQDVESFRDGTMSADELYDALTQTYGADAEEADEFINILEDGDDDGGL